MKPFKLIASVLGIGLVGGAIALLVTNPKQDAYEAYAVTQLKSQLDEDLCKDAPAFLKGGCTSLVSNSDGLLKTTVSSSTIRRNYYVLSIYETELDPMKAIDQIPFDQVIPGVSLSIGNAEGLPSYHAKTVGILGQFITYEAKRN
ncbi:MAG: DUF4359 domain-containing protein [Cyanobacteria bacterium P01_F01_bin.150]